MASYPTPIPLRTTSHIIVSHTHCDTFDVWETLASSDGIMLIVGHICEVFTITHYPLIGEEQGFLRLGEKTQFCIEDKRQ